MGLPGSGKTTLASKLAPLLNAKWLNNDEARKAANDWDFSEEGRIRQAKRMADIAEKYRQEDQYDYLVTDYICPTPKTRELFQADYTVWVDTIDKGRFEGVVRGLRPQESGAGEPSHSETAKVPTGY